MIDFRDVEDIEKVEVKAYSIDPTDPQKRLRVLGGWMLTDIVEDINTTNFGFHVMTFLKQCDLLELKYPIHEKHITDIKIDFWSRAQQKFKLLKEMERAEAKLHHQFEIIQDLKKLRFL